jgi:phosphohistidine phosphatase
VGGADQLLLRVVVGRGNQIAGRDLVPDRVLCSPVHRARQTLAALKPHLPASTKIVFADDLYGAAGDYRETIAAHGKDAARLMVVGHNPPIQATALALAATGDVALRSRLAAKFPTAALAVIAFRDGDWPAILAGGGRLEAFLRPRDLGADDEGD